MFALPKNDRRQDYLRSRLMPAMDGGLEAVPFEVQDSSMMRPLAASDCLVIRPPHAPALPAGSEVPIITFPGGPVFASTNLGPEQPTTGVTVFTVGEGK